MKRRHDSPWPVIVGLIFAATVHLLAAPPASRWLSTAKRMPGPADLRVENIIVPRDVLLLNQPNAVSFDVANRGMTAAAVASWEDRVYLSTDDRLDDGDTLLIAARREGELPAGQRYRSGEHTIVIPPGVEPPFYLLFQADALNEVDERWHEDNNVRARRFDPVTDPLQPQVAVGHPDAPDRLTVAWIAYNDFRELMARPSVTEQPAIQNVVEPIDAAPLELDPTPPTAPLTEDDAQTAAEPGGSLAQKPSPAEPTAPALPAEPNPAVSVAPEAGDAEPARPDLQSQPGEGDSAADAAPAGATEPAAPTSVPRDAGEASPTRRYPERLEVHPGETLVGEGIEIKTARPDFSPVARASTLPDNPQAQITFDATGVVVEARLTRSSGSDNIDAPILRSLYKWKASGPQIDEQNGRLIFDVTIILRD